MKHLPWNTYLAMSGKRSHQLSDDERTSLQAVLAVQYRAQADPNSSYWQEQVANCRHALTTAFPDHLPTLELALPELFTPDPTETWRSRAEFLLPRTRQVYTRGCTAADLIAAFTKGDAQPDR